MCYAVYYCFIYKKYTMKIKTIMAFMLYATLSVAQDGLVGEYYNGVNFDEKVLTRTDAKIDFDWRHTSPQKGVVNYTYYSVRWTGKLLAPETGKYLFSATFDDGIRLWVNDVPLINAWDLHDMGDFSNNITLEKGKLYIIKVEYFNAMREGEIKLLWQLPSQVNGSTYSYNNFQPIANNYFYQPKTELPPPAKSIIVASKTPIMPKTKPPTIVKPKPTGPSVFKAKETEKPTSAFEKVDNNLDTKQVFFIRSVNKMTDNSIERLDKVVDFLKKNQTAKIELNGHTDVMGDAQKNIELSVSRAKGVADYLISKGIIESRIAYQGFGGTKPSIADPKTEEERALNRRVDFVILR
jgi:outer membrane protein OmpA-like peptidoglycan-associated protein